MATFTIFSPLPDSLWHGTIQSNIMLILRFCQYLELSELSFVTQS